MVPPRSPGRGRARRPATAGWRASDFLVVSLGLVAVPRLAAPRCSPGQRARVQVPATTMPNPSSTSSHGPIPEEIRNLLADVETFVADTLKGENLSKKAKEKRDSLIKKIKDVKSIYLQEFQDKGDAEEGDEYDDPFAGPPDTISLASERYEKDDDGPSDGNQFPPIAAQDLPFVLKAGYLEKRRKDHSFLGFEWQKRWCALSKTVFYYYGSDKDKQQKGEFAIEGYDVRMNNTLRKDAKKDCCFEICAPDKRIYQFTAASPKDAEEWVQQLKFILQDMGSDVIPEDDDERGELYDDVDHPVPVSPSRNQPIDDEIYEELPEEEEDTASVKMDEQGKGSRDSVHYPSGDRSTDYANFYQGLWDCTGALSDELSFKRGDVIYILSKEYNRYGWWVGEMKGAIGLVPKAYVMEMYDI
nr:src kinase-associated phosphoprotein 2 isoform X1 [Peromyscus maniculatus bairdii]